MINLSIRTGQGRFGHIEEAEAMCPGGKNERPAATHQRMPGTLRSWKRRGTHSPLELPEAARPFQGFDFSPVNLTWDPGLQNCE